VLRILSPPYTGIDRHGESSADAMRAAALSSHAQYCRPPPTDPLSQRDVRGIFTAFACAVARIKKVSPGPPASAVGWSQIVQLRR
jgi:hypothetical protein